MPRLGCEKTGVETGKVRWQMRHQRGKSFAGSGLDQGANDKDVYQAIGLCFAHGCPQRSCVSRGRYFAELDVTRRHDFSYLLEVTQLLTRQSGHSLHQFRLVRIAVDETQRRRSSLEFAICMVE